jgi:hypothetical protein
MSFDIYLQSFENGLPVGIPLEQVRQIFGSHLTELEPDYWTLSFGPSESCSVFPTVVDGSPHLVHSLSIGNPCDTPMLWDGLFGLLGFGKTVLHFPGCSGPLVLQAFAAGHMPRTMLESLGSPIIVSSGQDIQHLVLAA